MRNAMIIDAKDNVVVAIEPIYNITTLTYIHKPFIHRKYSQ